ncbi:sel1 repeat family protein [Chakrabartia godavariana]|nr:sel1 repeat family protein [Chakrabartia godavariana]
MQNKIIKCFFIFSSIILLFHESAFSQRPLTETEAYYVHLKDLIVSDKCAEARALALNKADLQAVESIDQLCQLNKSGRLDKENAEFIWAMLGWDIALYISGASYIRGDRGFTKDPAMGISMLRAASQKGNVNASLELGNIYLSGEIVPQNKSEAFSFYMKCALLDNEYCSYAVGKSYFEGIGTVKNDRLAVSWYQRSASKSFAPAQFSLGLLQSEGIGLAKNKVASFELFMSAAKQGHKEAQIEVATAYAVGDGVERDDFKAHVWILVAIKNGAIINGSTSKIFDPIFRKRTAEADVVSRRCLVTNYAQCF